MLIVGVLSKKQLFDGATARVNYQGTCYAGFLVFAFASYIRLPAAVFAPHIGALDFFMGACRTTAIFTCGYEKQTTYERMKYASVRFISYLISKAVS